jgi:hypothetical protein
MAGLVAVAKNAMLDRLGVLVGLVSLHTADPGAAGGNELSGGSPPYSRQPIEWAVAGGAVKASGGAVIFNVPGKTTVTHLGYWSADGTYCGSRPLDLSESFNGPGTYTLAAGQITERVG